MATTARRKTETRYSFEQFTAIRRYQPTLVVLAGWERDRVRVNTSGQFNLWRQSSAGGFPAPIDALRRSDACARLPGRRMGRQSLFAADRDGDEFYQIYTDSRPGGGHSALTDAPAFSTIWRARPWSPDGAALVYAGNDRSQTDQDVLIRDLHDRRSPPCRGLRRDVTSRSTWSPDGKSVTVVDFKSNTNMDLYVLTVDDEEMQHLTPHEGEIQYFPGPWAADGSGFYVLSDRGARVRGACLLGPARGYCAGLIRRMLTSSSVALVGRWAVPGLDRQRGGVLRSHMCADLRSNQDVALPEIPKGVIDVLAISRSGGKVGFLLAGATHPNEVYVLDLERSTLTQLTESMS